MPRDSKDILENPRKSPARDREGTPRGPSEAHVESGFNLAHFVVYSTGLSHGIFTGFILGISRCILDARDAIKMPLCLYLLSTCIRVSAGSSIRPLLYIVGVGVMYTVGVGVYIGMGILCTIVSGVILFVFIVLIRVCVFMRVGICIVYMCMMYCICIGICGVSSRC